MGSGWGFGYRSLIMLLHRQHRAVQAGSMQMCIPASLRTACTGIYCRRLNVVFMFF